MITKKEIKKVEKLQKIDRDIQCLKQDYRNVRHHCVTQMSGIWQKILILIMTKLSK